MEKNKFSIRARGESLKYAIDGLYSLFRSEHNMLLHLVATLLVIIMAIVFPVSVIEGVTLTLATGFVWVAEIFNTTIEKTMDFISDERKPEIKLIKDLAASAVLVAAITALLAGGLIFIPKF